MPFLYPEQQRALQASQITERELPPSPMPTQALPPYTANPDRDAALLAASIAGQQALPAYAANSDAKALALANEIVAAQRPVMRQGGWIAPVGRERYVANPYYTAQGSTDLYNRTGLLPTIYQSDPYATASYAVGADGSVSGLVGFPSRYPHVINLGFHDYTMPFMAAWSPFMYQGLQLMNAARAAGGGVTAGGGGGVGGGARRKGSAAASRAPAMPASPDIRTSTDRGPYPGWNGPMSEEELAIQRATQQISNASVLPEEPGLWQRDPNFSVPHYGGGTPAQASSATPAAASPAVGTPTNAFGRFLNWLSTPSAGTPTTAAPLPDDISPHAPWSLEGFTPVSEIAASPGMSDFTPQQIEPMGIAYSPAEAIQPVSAQQSTAPSKPTTPASSYNSRKAMQDSFDNYAAQAQNAATWSALGGAFKNALLRAIGQATYLGRPGPAIRDVPAAVEPTMNPGATVEPQVVWPPAESRLRPVLHSSETQDNLDVLQYTNRAIYERLQFTPEGALVLAGLDRHPEEWSMFLANPNAYFLKAMGVM